MKKKNKGKWDMEPQKSSAAQYLTYIASYGISDEKFEIRYEDENIWMSQKMLAAVYGVEVPNVAYHLRKIFTDGEIDKDTSIKEILIDVGDGRKFAPRMGVARWPRAPRMGEARRPRAPRMGENENGRV